MEEYGDAMSEKMIINRDLLDPEIYNDFYLIESVAFIQEILNASPSISAIVNSQRQIVLSNSHLLRISAIDTIEQILGKKPGKVLSCINQNKYLECGSTEKCQYCGIVNTLKKSQHLGKQVINECRITAKENERLVSYDFKVTCSPIHVNDKTYTLMHLEDISNEKRKEILENVFFHDVMNRLGGFSGIVQLIKANNKQPELNEYVSYLETIGDMVIEDIQNQQYLKSAENGNLIVNIREHTAGDIIESVRRQISFHPVINASRLEVMTSSDDFKINTDGNLLKRILLNMAKNAAEASPECSTIKISARKLNNNALFLVNNQGTIPIDIQHQIFQRSFSTKGHGRGLGTYSIRLFGETCLNGKVYFKSDNSEGTTFIIELPLLRE